MHGVRMHGGSWKDRETPAGCVNSRCIEGHAGDAWKCMEEQEAAHMHGGA